MNSYVSNMMVTLLFFFIFGMAPVNGFAADANVLAVSPPTAAPSVPTTTAPTMPSVPVATEQAAPNPATAAPPANPAANADADKLVSVEAEGQGETKILAMKAAWMEAVRLGIGMYLDAKTTAIDDAVTEEIVTHSRGRVNSYEELGSEQTASGWKVRIRANIEKDVLQESAKSVQSKTVKVNPSHVGETISGREEKRSAQELLAAFQLPSWKDFLTMDFQSERKGGEYVGKFSLRVNMDKYTQVFVKELGDILGAVASHKREGRFDAKQSTLIKQVMQGNEAFNNIQNVFGNELWNGRFEDMNQIYLIVNQSYYMNYAVSSEVFNELASKVKGWPDSRESSGPGKIRLLVDAMEKGNILDSVFQKGQIWDCFLEKTANGDGKYRIIIYPAFGFVGEKGASILLRFKTDFTLPIKLSDDVMMRMDELKGSLEFE